MGFIWHPTKPSNSMVKSIFGFPGKYIYSLRHNSTNLRFSSLFSPPPCFLLLLLHHPTILSAKEEENSQKKSRNQKTAINLHSVLFYYIDWYYPSIDRRFVSPILPNLGGFCYYSTKVLKKHRPVFLDWFFWFGISGFRVRIHFCLRKKSDFFKCH